MQFCAIFITINSLSITISRNLAYYNARKKKNNTNALNVFAFPQVNHTLLLNYRLFINDGS